MKKGLLTLVGGVGRLASERFELVPRSYFEELRREIIVAGDLGITPTQLLGVQILCGVAFPILWLPVFREIEFSRFLVAGPHAVLVGIGLMAFGFWFPRINIRERATKRQNEMVRQLPDMIDLLTICVEGGLDFLSALRVVVDNQPPGVLHQEFDRFLKQLELGTPRVDALHELSRRVDAADLSSVCAVLVQASKLGSPLGAVLRLQSELLRTRRGQRAEKAAAQATIKVMAPLMLCIFPSAFIAILGPVILQIMKTLR